MKQTKKTCQKKLKKDNEHVEDHSVQSIQGIHSSVLKDSIYYSSMQISQNCGAGSDKEKLVIHGKRKVNYKIWLIYNCNLVEILSIDRNGKLLLNAIALHIKRRRVVQLSEN